MNNLIVKEVDFYKGKILGVQTPEGKVYMGVRKACMDIGLTRGQLNNEISKIQKDVVLSKGARNLRYPTDGGIQEVLAIEKEFVPLWLAKISITPKMQKDNPEVVERLVKYQLEAKDVLAGAFLGQAKPACIEDVLIQSLQEMKAMKQEVAATKEIASEAKQEVQAMRDVISLDTTSWRTDTRNLIVKIAKSLGGNQYIRDVNAEIYTLLDKRMGTNVKQRLTNKRRRMAEEGVCKSKRDKLNRLDVIADDKKLIEGYVAIAKEMAIKYSVA